MKLKNWLILFLISAASCAKVPIQAVELSQALKDEGGRMHQLNLALVEYVFNEKKHLVNEFMTNEYTPELVKNVAEKLPPGIDFKAELPEIIQAINPKIDARRDSLLGVLQNQKMLIVQQLNTDYKVYDEAFAAMQNLLLSASKLNSSRTSVYDDIKKLSAGKIDLQGINNALDNFIKGGGSVGEKATVLAGTIQTFLK